MTVNSTFTFHDPGKLIDHELELVLIETRLDDSMLEQVPAYRFEMRSVNQNILVGNIDLRIGNSEYLLMYAGHIGYGVEPQHRGHRYAARSCRLILPLAKSHNISPIWITCNPDNISSRKTCEILGAEFVETVALPKEIDMYTMGERFKCRYRKYF